MFYEAAIDSMKKEFPDEIKMPEEHSLDSELSSRAENGNCLVVQANGVPGNDSGQRNKHKENLKLISEDNFGKSSICWYMDWTWCTIRPA